MRREEAADRRIAARPIADQHLHPARAKGLRDLGAVDRRPLVDLAAEAPVGGEIDEDGAVRGAQLGESRFAERLGSERVGFMRGRRRGELDQGQRRDHRDRDESEREPGPAPALPRAEPPQSEAERDRRAKAERHAVHAAFLAEHPGEAERGQEHRHGKDALEGSHPRPRLGQPAAQGGDEAKQQEGQREAEAEADEHRKRGPDRQHQRRAERDAEEGPGAGGRDEGRERAGEEGAARPAAAGERVAAAEDG